MLDERRAYPRQNGLAAALLHAQDAVIREEHLPHLSPLGWKHINLTGDYV